MINNINEILKTMGNAFTFSNEGEMLSSEQKKELLARKNSSSVLNKKFTRVVLAGDEEFSTEALEKVIALCKEKNAMLDLLCVTPERNSELMHLTTALSFLENKKNLDFQVTRRNGDLLVEIKNYIRERSDILMLLISESKKVRNHEEQYKKSKNSLLTMKAPKVKLLDDLMYA